MIGFRDRDVMTNWSSSFVDEETSRRVVNFISDKKKVNAIVTTESSKKYSFESLGEKQKIAFNVVFDHYKGDDKEE